jgi:hypothetical protein
MAGAPNAPDTLTLKYRMEPMPPLVEPIPGAITEGRAYYGKLTSARPACQRGRVVFARYEFPPSDADPLIRPMWGQGGAHVLTDQRGLWAAEPVVFAGLALRVTAFVKTKPASPKPCPKVESPTLTLPAQVAG